jgi:hypothetical protein
MLGEWQEALDIVIGLKSGTSRTGQRPLMDKELGDDGDG